MPYLKSETQKRGKEKCGGSISSRETEGETQREKETDIQRARETEKERERLTQK